MLDHNLCITAALCVCFVVSVSKEKVALLEPATFVLVCMFLVLYTGPSCPNNIPITFLLLPGELILSLSLTSHH